MARCTPIQRGYLLNKFTTSTDMYSIYCKKYYNELYGKYSMGKTSILNCVTILLQPTLRTRRL